MEEKTGKDVRGEEEGVRQTNGDPEKSRTRCSVDTGLLPIKALYFMIYGAQGCQMPYVMMFTKQLGLTSQESGMLFGVLPFLSFLAQVVIGMVADRWRKHKLVLITSIFIAGVCNVLIAAVPARSHKNILKGNVEVNCHTYLSPVLTYCGDDVPVYVADESNGGVIKSVDYLLPGNKTPSSDRSEFPLKEDTDEFESFCPKHVIEALNALAKPARNSKNTMQCHVSCSTAPETNEVHGKICLRNISDANTSFTTLSDSCSGVEPPRFPEIMYLQNMKKGKAGSQAVIDGSYPVQYENDHDNCSRFHVSSFLVDSRLFDELSCNPERHLDCMIQCNPVRENRCHDSTFSLDLTFWLVLISQLIGTLALSPVFALIDAACYGILKDNWRMYGHQRAWGTIGWLVVSIGTSLGTYVGKGLDYALLFYVHGAMMLLSVFITYFVKMSSVTYGENILKNTRKVLVLPKVAVLLTVTLVLGLMLGATLFILWYLEDLGAPPEIFGLYNVVGVTVEIPSFFVAGRLMKRFGTISCFCMGVVTMSLRLAGYALLVNPWVVLLVVTLHGVSAGLSQSSSTSYITLNTPPGMSATAQGLLNGVRLNMGRGIGVILAGWMMGAVGARVTFASFAAAGLIASLLYALFHYFAFRETVPSRAGSDQQTEEQQQTLEVSSQDPAATDGHDTSPGVTDQPTLEMTSDLSSPFTAREHTGVEPRDPLLAGGENNTIVEKV